MYLFSSLKKLGVGEGYFKSRLKSAFTIHLAKTQHYYTVDCNVIFRKHSKYC